RPLLAGRQGRRELGRACFHRPGGYVSPHVAGAVQVMNAKLSLFSLLTVLAALGGQPSGRLVEGGKTAPDGTEEITCDLPEAEKKRNTGGRDGLGLCVFTSIEDAARYQNERRLLDFQTRMRAEPGGGYPEKVDRRIARHGKGAAYLQYEGTDPAVLRAALATGRMPCVTYNGFDPHYRGGVAHMVNLVHLSDRWACITDNNFPSDKSYVWMTP